MAGLNDNLTRSIATSIENGKDLLDDAKLMFDFHRHARAFALAVLAQEEFAKAFVLQLVVDGALPWIAEVRRSIVRHQCKHLMALVMEWLPGFHATMAQLQGHIDEHDRRMNKYEEEKVWEAPVEEEFCFPVDVATALNIYRHEEVERFRSGNAWKDEDWAARGKARKLADGVLNRKKQSAFYVDIRKSGEVGLHPGMIAEEDAAAAISRAEQLSEEPMTCSDEYTRLKDVLPALFASLKNEKATA
jgi:AbiV family abortive infection protein